MTIAVKALILDHATEHLSLADALEWFASVIAGPAVEPYPHPTPADAEEWREMRCRDDGTTAHCHCRWCTWERKNRPGVDNWNRSQASHRLQPKHPAAFGSTADAVTQWLGWHTDGHAAQSSLGATLDRGRDNAALGVAPSIARGANRDPRPIYQAGLSVDVERAMVHAYQPEQARQGVPTWGCIRVLCSASTVPDWTPESEAESRGVPTASVKAIVRMGKRGVTVELAARGMVPEPMKPRALVQAIRARREELERRSVSDP
jgi:hypothetical protein